MKLELPIPDQGDGRLVVESVEVHERAPGRFELAYSPGLIEGLAAGDEITLEPTMPGGYRLLRRGGNVCVWFFFSNDTIDRKEITADLAAGIESLGGRMDGTGYCSLVFTVPVKAGFAAIEALFNSAESRSPGATWMFGNVYDPADGTTPLNWWIEDPEAQNR